MTNNYHDQLDAFEARVRAEQEEADIEAAEKLAKELRFTARLLGRIEEQDGSDNTMSSAMRENLDS